ncbi:TetR/AcrR family transcriptional regulator [Streptomonospora nanhaiensis]|uniref:TetR/AcrR family transcriptional regulator n=1 Tax=Streptomonospora nanhaiensis TaxID=1323731 RepID=UPI001C383BD9|nr:TetR/AcrR family transcriptional regulator [Streptomonospora nanhaiensis]MBV2364061.1 TetR/AcrR family transcriptional regulator [Streptomonospora nanhaiensis]
MPERTGYHHGDLRRALLDAAVELIAERGTAAVSLRELARRAEVSHAAPAHHFTDKAGLFTAIAVDGFRMLADSLAVAERAGEVPEPVDPDNPSGALYEMGLRYVRFALEHPGHFDVMFRSELYHADDPELAAASARAAALLETAVPGGPGGPRTPAYTLAAWSAAHGFAVLWREGVVDTSMRGDDPEKLFRQVAAVLFHGYTTTPAG